MRVGLDFGATRVKAGLVDDDGRIVKRASAATKPERGRDHVLSLVKKLTSRVDPDGVARGVGIGFAGMVDPRSGRILHTTETMPPLTDFPLRDFVKKATGRRAAVDNDGNAHALAESRFGVGRDAKALVMFVLGTGVGGGVVIDKKVWVGAGAMAAHLGHVKVRPNGRRCACGARGCVEAYAGAYAIEAQSGTSAKAVFAAARDGDDAAKKIVRAAGEALGTACADVTTILNPDVIAIGGGLTRSWPLLEPHVMRTFERDALSEAAATTALRRAKLGNDAGIIGASLLVANATNRS